jgi:hypothetical protein
MIYLNACHLHVLTFYKFTGAAVGVMQGRKVIPTSNVSLLPGRRNRTTL